MQFADGLSCTPHLHVAHSLQLLVQTVAIVDLGVGVDGDLSLFAHLYGKDNARESVDNLSF